MKRTHLEALCRRLRDFERVIKARRIEENVIEITFSDATRTHHTYLFDMTRGRSAVYKADDAKRPMHDFSAPFDTLLLQLFSHAKLLDAMTVNNDRIVRIVVAPKSAYKNQTVALQLEFTGKNTNAILLDKDDTVLEALRHIGADRSFRTVRPGETLVPLPPCDKREADTPIPSDIDAVLSDAYRNAQARRLEQLRANKMRQLEKKIARIDALIAQLPDEAALHQEAARLREEANLILANLHRIKPYDSVLKTHDFEGREISIDLPSGVPVNRMSEHRFNQAKKAEKKSEHIHIERQNLQSKKRFYDNILYAVQNATDPYELEMLVPKRARSKRKKEKQRIGELFWIEGYKVFVGRNAKENQALLESARANDIWMHVRDVPGSHVIIRTDKQHLPDSLIEAAAKLCVDFSVDRPGNYDVDYTKRKFVKMTEGSHVVYDKYQTVHVLKEGVEIRV